MRLVLINICFSTMRKCAALLAPEASTRDWLMICGVDFLEFTKIIDGTFVVFFLPDGSTDLLRVRHVLPYFTAAVL